MRMLAHTRMAYPIRVWANIRIWGRTYLLCIVIEVPSLRDLYRYVTPQYATEWKAIGAELGFSDPKLNIIRANHPCSIKDCCNEMLSQWLRIDSTPSWKKIFNAIDSPAVCGGQVIDKGNISVQLWS